MTIEENAQFPRRALATVITEQVQPNGDVVFSGDSGDIVAWDDLRFPAQGLNPSGQTNAPTVDQVETSFPGTLLFSGSVDNIVAGVAVMPHKWRASTSIHPHIHWKRTVTAVDAIAWEFYYRTIGNAGDVESAWVGPVAGVLSPIGNPAIAGTNLITTFGVMPMTGLRAGAMFSWRLYRRGSSDASAALARLIELDFHYQVDKLGTFEEYPGA